MVDNLVALAESGYRAGVIYADPPWPFRTYSKERRQRTPDRHYDQMTIDDIKALPVAPLAADNCALMLWGTWPDLPEVLDVIRAWGFEYKTAALVWVKLNPNGEVLFVEEDDLFTGMGYGTRASTAYMLRASRASPLRLDAEVDQVVRSLVLAHSEKPEEVARRIERLYLGLRLELFARRSQPGWVCSGNEIPPLTIPDLTEAAE
jgi:N6-adenosine-specific RNA methylase IME4